MMSYKMQPYDGQHTSQISYLQPLICLSTPILPLLHGLIDERWWRMWLFVDDDRRWGMLEWDSANNILSGSHFACPLILPLHALLRDEQCRCVRRRGWMMKRKRSNRWMRMSYVMIDAVVSVHALVDARRHRRWWMVERNDRRSYT